MFASFELIKAFFKHPIGILISLVVVVLLTFGFAEHLMLKSDDTKIVAQATQIGSLQAEAAQFQGAASECSAGTQALQTADATATASAAVAVSEAGVKAMMYTNHATQILSQKPASSDDYTASKQLMDQLIDNRQAQIKGN